jgi:FkbM family methyltransferase
MLDLGTYLKRYGVVPRGVIHIGAHEGKEAAKYEQLGFEKVVFVEANPAVFERLRRNVEGRPGVVAIQAAVADRDGEVQLNVTSFDQSSSILPLGKHAEVYPDITVAKTVTVRARRLDTLLAENGLRSEDYNVINIDIQGAELLALRGAEETLRSIEFINTEVNLAELYQGCALLPDLERHLAERGLHRAAIATPWHPTWGDAIYVRRPVVSMRTLGANGRFANQLFQYFALRLYAKRFGAIVQTPPWEGQGLYGFSDPAPILEFPQLRESGPGFNGAMLARAEPPAPAVDLWGYFQGHTREIAAHRDELRRLLAPVPERRAEVEELEERVRARGHTVVGVHVRRGDYGYEHFFRSPTVWYRAWLEEVWPTLDRPVLYVASDDLDRVLPAFKRFAPVSLRLADRAASRARGAFLDLHLLAQADILAISNSSYSFLAALLAERATAFLRPDLAARALVPFDPWDAEVLLRDRQLREGEQAELDALEEPRHRYVARRDKPLLSRAARSLRDGIFRPLRRLVGDRAR